MFINPFFLNPSVTIAPGRDINVKITNSDLLNQVNMADIPESPTARNTITPELGREDIIDSTLFK